MATDGNRGPEPSDKTGEIVKTLRTYERPFMGTGELADELGYDSNPGVTKHLERAVEAGHVEKATISGYNVWYLQDLAAPGGKGGQPSNEHSDDSTVTQTEDGKREKDSEETATVHNNIIPALEGVSDQVLAFAVVVGVVAAVVNSTGIMVAMAAIFAVSLMASTIMRLGRF
jgi:hypothetical protein